MQHRSKAKGWPRPFLPDRPRVPAVSRLFGRFWNSDRLVTRRIHGLAALDPDFEQVVRARDERRRQGLRILVQRLVEKYGQPVPEAFDEAVDVLYTLISFECFDILAGPTRSLEEVVPVVQRLARATNGLKER